VIASRLTEDPFINVLLLEAGGVGSIITEVPGMVGIALNSNIDWKYK
jgi:choline dehydrogenase-like flavoprotein